jgi:CheY-like chemotaxis protein
MQAANKGIILENRLPEQMNILVDADIFGEVLHNILTNAIKFCTRGDKICLFRQEDGQQTIAIRDTGVGIPASILPDLFKHEIKTSTTGTAGEIGTGLGLPYCRDIVRAHNGEITVESSLTDGTVFYITLPMVSKVVLVVDDQEAHANIMRQIITQHFKGVEVIYAEGGYQALRVLSGFRPDLIISDINMPNYDGWMLLKKIRGLEKLRDIPCVIATAEGSIVDAGISIEDIREKAATLGANGCIVKPVIEQELIEKVSHILGRE